MVLKYSEKIHKLVETELAARIKRGEMFALTFDEWTSVKNRRYMNVNIHAHEKFWNLGLCRIYGSMPGETCVQLLREKLSDFNIKKEKNIVSITTDGAAVMQKVGRLIGTHHQLCLAHGIHLAVAKILYKRGSEQKSDENER